MGAGYSSLPEPVNWLYTDLQALAPPLWMLTPSPLLTSPNGAVWLILEYARQTTVFCFLFCNITLSLMRGVARLSFTARIDRAPPTI